jgi:hypothetical protein
MVFFEQPHQATPALIKTRSQQMAMPRQHNTKGLVSMASPEERGRGTICNI